MGLTRLEIPPESRPLCDTDLRREYRGHPRSARDPTILIRRDTPLWVPGQAQGECPKTLGAAEIVAR